MALGERDRAVLDLERGWWLEAGTKSELVRGRLGISLSRYNQLLGRLAESKDAFDYDPLLVSRLRRVKRDRRWRANGDLPVTRPHERPSGRG